VVPLPYRDIGDNKMENQQLIRVACDVKDHLPLDQITPFQGELKTLLKEDYERLRKEILDTGFAFPMFVWKSESKFYLIGGHQRVRALKTMRDEGFIIPLVPVVYILADSYKQAKRRILQDASQYGTVERQGLYELMSDIQMDPGDFASSFKLPELNIPSFNAEYFLDEETGKLETNHEHDEGIPDSAETSRPTKQKDGAIELSEDDFRTFGHKCPRCGFEFDE
jgi:hypothetical protein